MTTDYSRKDIADLVSILLTGALAVGLIWLANNFLNTHPLLADVVAYAFVACVIGLAFQIFFTVVIKAQQILDWFRKKD